MKHLSAYGTTKRKAEDLILAANNSMLPNRKTLRSCSLRLVGMYGEGAQMGIRMAEKFVLSNMFVRLGSNRCLIPHAYVGNIAGAYIAAISRLRNTSSDESELPSPDGLAISLADNTPLTSWSQVYQPFVAQMFGAKPSRYYVPFWLLLLIAFVLELVSYLMKPFFRIKFDLSLFNVQCLYNIPIPRAEEARKYLGYEPLYSYKTSFAKSLKYYVYILKKP